MKVCHLTSVHPLNDTRIFHKECKSLAQAGHDVTLIIQHNKDEVIDGVRIIGLREPRNRFERIFWVTIKVFYYALKQKADVYHFHDLELIPAGLVLKLLGNKVIFDVHENSPQDILNKEWFGPLWVRKIVAFGVSIIEKIGEVFFDVIIVARPDIAEHFNRAKTRVITNAAILEVIDGAPDISVEKQKPVIIYAGNLTHIRGIKEIVQAMEIIGDKAELWLLGNWDLESFKRECEKLASWRYVRFLGYKSVQEVYSYMKKCDIGIVTFLPAPNHLTTLPNKPFEYMACRLPVIMSNFEYWRGIFNGCALFVDPKSPQQIAERINALLGNGDLRAKLGSVGRKFVEQKYSWEAERKKLFEVYENLGKL